MNTKVINFFLFVVFISLQFTFVLNATDWYVDNAATGANTGTSWTDAWQSFADIDPAVISPGDTLYISGGLTGTTKVYDEQLAVMTPNWPNGTPDNYITIQIGQDEGHNGIVEITSDPNLFSYAVAFRGVSYYNFSGQVGNNPERHIKITDEYHRGIYQAEGNGQPAHHINYYYLDILNSGQLGDGELNGIAITFRQASEISGEIAYCHIHNAKQDGISVNLVEIVKAPGYGLMKIHHNRITGIHDDGIAGGAGGIDVYNNYMGDRLEPLRGHPDAIQFYNSYYRIYNNYFHGFMDVESGHVVIYWEPNGGSQPQLAYQNDPSDFLLYNNIFYEDQIRNEPVGVVSLAVEGEDSASNILVANNIFNGAYNVGITLSWNTPGFNKEDVHDIYILNNIFLDATSGNPALNLTTPAANGGDHVDYGAYGSGASIQVDYNIYTGVGSSHVGGRDIDRNIWGTYQNFKSMTGAQVHDLNSPDVGDLLLDTNFNLLTESPLINQGVDLSAYFTTDFEGVSRPQGAAWDIGAYEYTTGTNISYESFEKLELLRIYPNPFRTETTIEYKLSEQSEIEILLYEINGRIVKTIYSGVESKGLHSIELSGRDLPPGIYLIKVTDKNQTAVRKCIIE